MSWDGKIESQLHLQYPDGIPARVKEAQTAVLSSLEPQIEHVKKVRFLRTFDKDHFESHLADHLVCSGVVVTLGADYQLRPEDVSWLHPLYCQMTGVFKGGSFTKLGCDVMLKHDSNASTGLYYEHVIDECGDSTQDPYTIVSMSGGSESRKMVREWLVNNLTVRDAYEKSATLTVGCGAQSFSNMKQCVEHFVKDAASSLGVMEDPLKIQQTNVFSRAKGSAVHFLNNAYQGDSQTYVHVSPLFGYSRMSYKRGVFVPASLLSSDSFVDPNALNSTQRQRIYQRCHWNEEGGSINTFALRKPVENWQEIVSSSKDRLQMSQCNFSHDGRSIEHLKPEHVIRMTLDHASASEFADPKFEDFLSENKVSIKCSDDVLWGLIPHRANSELLNPKYYDATSDTLIIPRDLAEKLIKK